jgi:hypothetical protein
MVPYWGNSAWPIDGHQAVQGRWVCDACNAMYVIPARLRYEIVELPLYGLDGKLNGMTFTQLKS